MIFTVWLAQDTFRETPYGQYWSVDADVFTETVSFAQDVYIEAQ